MKTNIKILSKYAIIVVFSFIILFLFSTSTSNLYGNYYEDDSAIFILMGKAITNGLIPYKDIFDHKGPILFFIQAIGQIICEGRTGIFLIQVIMLSITNIIFYEMARKFCNRKNAIYTLIICMSMFCLFMEEGNLTEELSLPFLAVCLFLAIKWVGTQNLFDNKIYKYGFIYGICFAIIAFIRINNAAIICGLILGIIIIFIKNKKYKELLKVAINFIFGIAAISIPICVFFYRNNALLEMLDGTFFYNLKYIKIDLYKEYDFMQKIKCSIHILILPLISFKIMNKEKNLNILMLVTSIITYIVLFIGEGFSHYYVISVPLVCVYVAKILGHFEKEENKEEIKIVYLILIIVCITYASVKILNNISYLMNLKEVNVETIESVIEKISEEKNDIFVYNSNISSIIYLYGDFFPDFKYVFHHQILMKVIPSIEKDIYKCIDYNEMNWIISTNIEKNKEKKGIDYYILNNYKLEDVVTVKLQSFYGIQEEELFLYKRLDNANNK